MPFVCMTDGTSLVGLLSVKIPQRFTVNRSRIVFSELSIVSLRTNAITIKLYIILPGKSSVNTLNFMSIKEIKTYLLVTVVTKL